MKKITSLFLALILAFSLTVPAFAVTPVTGVSLDQTEATLTPGETITLNVTITPEDATDKTIIWHSNREDVATISVEGEVTAVAEGTADISVLTQDGQYRDICRITVERNYVTGVTITPAGPEKLPVGRSRQLSAQVEYAIPREEGGEITWRSSDTEVATVSDSGLVTAQSEGIAEILALAADPGEDGGQVFQRYVVTVTSYDPGSEDHSLILDKSNLTRSAGQYQTVTLTAPGVEIRSGEDDISDNYALSYEWRNGEEVISSERTAAVILATLDEVSVSCTVTAVSKSDSSRVLTDSCTFTVQVLPGTVLGATAAVGSGPVSLEGLLDISASATVRQQLTQGNPESELTPAVPGLEYVVFLPDTLGGKEAGALSAEEEVRYFIDDSTPGEQLFSQLTFTPEAAGVYTIDFLAYGEETYYGHLEILVVEAWDPQPPATREPIACGSGGHTFSADDFADEQTDDPVITVVFGQPSEGQLLRSLHYGSGIPDTGERYFMEQPRSEDYAISELTYLPPADFEGQVSLPAALITQGGKTLQRTLLFEVSRKTDSAYFRDVTGAVGAWAADAVDFGFENELVNGTEQGIFSPGTSMTRAMLVTVLYRAAGSPEITASTSFQDLDRNSYYYKPVLWAYAMGVVNGISADTFSPNAPVTRQQIAAILYRYASATSHAGTVEGTLDMYLDQDQVDSYAVVPILWAVNRGIIQGTSSAAPTLSPTDHATRAQVVVMLHRYLAP